MDKLFGVAAGIDVHRDTVVVSIRTRKRRRELVETKTFGTFHDELDADAPSNNYSLSATRLPSPSTHPFSLREKGPGDEGKSLCVTCRVRSHFHSRVILISVGGVFTSGAVY